MIYLSVKEQDIFDKSICTPSVTRTHDLLLRRQSLYPAELWAREYLSIRSILYHIYRWYNAVCMRLLQQLFIFFLLIGVGLTLLARFHLVYPLVLFVFFVSLCTLFFITLGYFLFRLPFLTKWELALCYLLLFIWALHFLQVLVPETGFDALWYHLPVINQVNQAHGLLYLPYLYQSVNPLFSDLYFLTGFAVLGDTGAKFIAYIFGVFLVAASYALSRQFLARKSALAVAIIVSTFQVVSWQSASFYVDVAKAFFEIAGLLMIVSTAKNSKIQRAIGLLFFSASLATKVFSILLVPVITFSVGFKQFFSKHVFVYLLCLFGIPSIYYWFAYQTVGHPFYSIIVHTEKLAEIGGSVNIVQYVLRKSISLPTSLARFMLSRDYVYPLLPLLVIPVWFQISNIWKDTKLRVLFVFSASQWLIWWFVPPFSTRYALSGFITLLILAIFVVRQKYIKNKSQENSFVALLISFALLVVFPRILVANRSLTYILTNQTRQEYLQQFYDGSIDEKIENWYGYPSRKN